MKLFNYVTAAALAVGGITMVGCRDDGRTTDQQTKNAGDQTQHSANKAAQNADQAAQNAGQAAQNAGAAASGAANNAADKAGQAANNAGQALNNAADKAGQAANNAADKAGEAAKNAGNAAGNAKDAVVASVTPSGSSDVSGMRGAMEGILQNAMDPGNFKVMTNHFLKADRERLEAAAADKDMPLEVATKAFKEVWRAKYGGDAFGVMDAEKVFGADFVALNSADMKTGVATIKASHGMPEVKLPMVAEDGKWRLDVKDETDAAKLRQNLLQAVTELNGAASSWPADKVEAARIVSHKVFMALAK